MGEAEASRYILFSSTSTGGETCILFVFRDKCEIATPSARNDRKCKPRNDTSYELTVGAIHELPLQQLNNKTTCGQVTLLGDPNH